MILVLAILVRILFWGLVLRMLISFIRRIIPHKKPPLPLLIPMEAVFLVTDPLLKGVGVLFPRSIRGASWVAGAINLLALAIMVLLLILIRP